MPDQPSNTSSDQTLRCQNEPYLWKSTARVLSCTPVPGEGWGALLDEVLLYPEGGGQPADDGQVGGQALRGLKKTAAGVLHLLDAPVSGEVEVVVHGARRFDHMQQHTGQHLLSAVAQDRFGWATVAFHLGPETCDIELDGQPDSAGLVALESAVNAIIRQACPVRARQVTVDDMASLPVRSRGLPEGHTGPVRLVEIAGVDLNTCGGTHLGNTAEIQAIKLLSTEKTSRGLRLYFVAGGRVLRALGAALDRESALSLALTTGPAEHLTSVERLLGQTRDQSKQLKGLGRELGLALGAALVAGPDGVARANRPDGDLAFLSAMADGAKSVNPGLKLLLTAGTREGVFLLAGPESWVARQGPLVASALSGRGGGRGRYQGKAERVDLAAALGFED